MTITSPTDRTSSDTLDRSDREVNETPQVVMDTSVLVADPDSMFSYPGCDIVIPLTVLEELDDLKTRGDEVGWAARTVVRSLEELRISNGGDLATRVTLPDGGTLRIEINGLRLDRLEALKLDPAKEDNRILAAAIGVAGEHPNTRLVSADGSLRIKAAAVGISSEDHKNAATDTAQQAAGHAVTVDVDSTVIDDLYEHHRVGVDRLDDDSAAAENRALILQAGSASALTRVQGTNIVKIRTEQEAWGLRPRSKEQHFALDLLLDPDVAVVALTGHAGVGKTLLALAAGLQQTFEAGSRYDRIMILRPVVAVGSQDVGFLPGDLEEKLGPWFEAVVDAMVALGDRVTHRQAKEMLDDWVAEDRLSMSSVTHLRGRSLQRTWVMVDEVQNLEASVAKTILTRLGEGSKAVMVGDTTQIDSPFLSESTNALTVMTRGLAGDKLFGHVELLRGERSEIADLAAARL